MATTMHPDVTLSEILEMAEAILDRAPPGESEGALLASLVQQLDAHLSRGGVLPQAWRLAGTVSNPDLGTVGEGRFEPILTVSERGREPGR